jgi:prenyltransferase beta subunit
LFPFSKVSLLLVRGPHCERDQLRPWLGPYGAEQASEILDTLWALKLCTSFLDAHSLSLLHMDSLAMFINIVKQKRGWTIHDNLNLQ